MKRILPLTLVVCLLAATTAFANVEGAWTASDATKHPDPNRIYFNITKGRFHNWGSTMRVSDFTALTRAQIDATTTTPVQFELRREAGTASLEGTFKKGKGAGQFTFTGDRSYIDKIRALGVKFDLDDDDDHRHRGGRLDEGESEEDDLFALAIHDVSTTFIKQMQAEGYKVGLEKYLAMRIFDITPEYIREMRALGFKLDDDEIFSSKIHGVSPAYVRQMRATGWDLSFDELQATRIHGATPEFAAEMKKLGYSLDIDNLIAFRIHRVTADFINELRTLGYERVSADDLLAMRIHGVTPEFIRELKAAGYSKVPIDKLVSMRIHHIDANYLKKMGES
jgi:hypothetical protein